MLCDPFQALVPHARDLVRVAWDMSSTGEDQEPRLHLARLQGVVQLEGLRNGHARVVLAVEQQCRGARIRLGTELRGGALCHSGWLMRGLGTHDVIHGAALHERGLHARVVPVVLAAVAALVDLADVRCPHL